MYAKNITAFLVYMVKEGKLSSIWKMNHPNTLVTQEGEVINPRWEFFSLPP